MWKHIRSERHSPRTPLQACVSEIIWHYLKIDTKLTLQETVRVHKEVLQKHLPVSRHIYFRGEKSNWFTRNNGNLHIESKQTETASKAFSVTEPEAWNNLPKDIWDLTSNIVFKKGIKKSYGRPNLKLPSSGLIMCFISCKWTIAFTFSQAIRMKHYIAQFMCPLACTLPLWTFI